MKKKILLLAVSVLFSCMFTLPISAASFLNVVPDAAKSAITVSGAVDANKGNSLLLLRFLDKNNDEIFVDYTRTQNANGIVGFEFDKLYLPETLTSGTYTIEVSGKGLEAPLTKNYVYTEPREVLAALRAIATVNNTVSSSVSAVLTANDNKYANVLGVDYVTYKGFTQEAKAAFEKIMKSVQYNLPSEDEIALTCIERETNRFLAAHKAAMASALFVMADDRNDISNWINNFYDDPSEKQDPGRDENLLGPDPTANLCIKNEDAEFLKLFDSVKNSNDFIKRFIAANDSYSISQIKEYINTITLLSVICENTDSQALDVLENYPTYFVDINWAKFNSLTTLQKASVLDEFAGISYEDCTAAVTAFNDLLDEETFESNVQSNAGGGGGGSSSKRGTEVSISGSVLGDIDKEESITPFTDINDALWAEEAILYLHHHGIINGRAEGLFAPNANVTRAEFVKMVTNAMSIGINTADQPFKDVDTNSWYAPYVAAAYNKGLITGDENNCFSPEANITRQDMVTILFRAKGIEADENLQLDFWDAYKISDYARSAIAYFSNAGIVNGMGDGSFGPSENATRAQTATVLYKLMTVK